MKYCRENIQQRIMYFWEIICINKFLRLFWGVVWAPSAPGRAAANFINNAFILNPTLAGVSMNRIESLVALSSPSSIDTCRFSDKSFLLPTNVIMTSDPKR